MLICLTLKLFPVQVNFLSELFLFISYVQVLLECAGLSQPLFVIQGSCLGMEINLDTTAIPFGAVVQRSQTSRKIVMCNTGDMNAK